MESVMNVRLFQKLQFVMVYALLLAPAVTLAAEAEVLAGQFVQKINDVILFPLIALLIGVALLVFFYGAFEYVLGASNDSKREQGKRHLLWGLIGLLVMLSAMAILSVAAGTFGLQNELNSASNPIQNDGYIRGSQP